MTTAPSPPLPPAPSEAAYEHVGRQAWIILWAAFLSFLFLLIGTPLAINYALHNATLPQPTEVESLRGITLIYTRDSEAPMPVVNQVGLRAGDVIRTDENARANITFYDREMGGESLALLQLRSSSELIFNQARTPRFGLSALPDRIDLKLAQGRARITAAPAGARPLHITVETLHGVVRMQGGDDIAIAVNNEVTEVIVRGGGAEVEAMNRIVILGNGRRATIALGEPPSHPLHAAINLVRDGNFQQPLGAAWTPEALVTAANPENVVIGAVSIIDSSDRKAAYFQREGNDGLHSETSLVQQIDADVLDFDSLILRMDVLLLSQNLPGCGQLSSECPLMARIDFIDATGNPRHWVHGFYLQDPVQNWPIENAEKIPSFVWFEYESPDLLQSPSLPRPQKITSIRIYASGHDYRSQVSGVGLIAR